MLVLCKTAGVEISPIKIDTIYVDENKSSHFNPLLDSMKIYFVFVRYMSVSLITASIDFVIFFSLYHLTKEIFIPMAFSRGLAATFQYISSRNLVFKYTGSYSRSFISFMTLVVLSGLFSYLFVDYFVSSQHFPVVFAKIISESMLFLATFAIQREFIFRKKFSLKK